MEKEGDRKRGSLLERRGERVEGEEREEEERRINRRKVERINSGVQIGARKSREKKCKQNTNIENIYIYRKRMRNKRKRERKESEKGFATETADPTNEGTVLPNNPPRARPYNTL